MNNTTSLWHTWAPRALCDSACLGEVYTESPRLTMQQSYNPSYIVSEYLIKAGNPLKRAPILT